MNEEDDSWFGNAVESVNRLANSSGVCVVCKSEEHSSSEHQKLMEGLRKRETAARKVKDDAAAAKAAAAFARPTVAHTAREVAVAKSMFGITSGFASSVVPRSGGKTASEMSRDAHSRAAAGTTKGTGRFDGPTPEQGLAAIVKLVRNANTAKDPDAAFRLAGEWISKTTNAITQALKDAENDDEDDDLDDITNF